jgi:hypothetical protein
MAGITTGSGSVMVRSGIVLIPDDAVYGSIGANAERKRQRRNHRKPGTLAQDASGVAKILKNEFEIHTRICPPAM